MTAGVPPEQYSYDYVYINLETLELKKGIPKRYKEALYGANAVNWIIAMEFEIRTLTKLCTSWLVPLPKGKKMIKTKWVYDVKRNGRSNTIRYKARLIAEGFSLIPGVGFTEVFSPVIKFQTIRFFFAMSVHYGWHRTLLYARNAFVGAPLQYKIYIQQPDGLELCSYEGYVYCLNKVWCGLSQASGERYVFLDRCLA